MTKTLVRGGGRPSPGTRGPAVPPGECAGGRWPAPELVWAWAETVTTLGFGPPAASFLRGPGC